MTTGVEKQGNKVTLINESIIKASHDSTTSITTLPLSTFDLANNAYPVTYFYVYKPPNSSSININHDIVSTIKSSLARTLTHFFPFAGRADVQAGHILCNNEGIRFLDVSADFSLSTLELYLPKRVAEAVMLPVDHDFLLTVQLATYTCGGFSLVWTFNHLVCDASGFAMFLSCFSEIGRAKVSQLSGNVLSSSTTTTTYSHDRSALRIKRPELTSGHTCRALVERAYIERSADEIGSVPPAVPMSSELMLYAYHIKRSSIDDLQQRACQIEGRRSTRFEAFSAYVWKAMATVLNGTQHDRCQMVWIIDGRRWWSNLNDTSVDKNKNFVGNLVLVAASEEKVENLKEKNLANIALVASTAIHEACNQDYFMEVRDYIECSQPKVVLPKALAGSGVPSLIMNGLHNKPMMDGDFGFGGPSLCVALPSRVGESLIPGLSVISSGRKDGSWFAYGALWPELAKVLEADSEQVFCPITSEFILGE